MLTIVSPAKTLDFESKIPTEKFSSPAFLDRSRELTSTLKNASPQALCKLMGISKKLGELNAERYQNWSTPFSPENARQAIYAFKGDVYLGLEAEKFNDRDLNFAQKHLRILSGLYGLLKPLDLIQPYRLEMGTRLATSKGKDLYDFWGTSLSTALSADLRGQRNKTLINLSSNEYFKSIDHPEIQSKLIQPVFKDYSKGTYKVMSFFAKKARGMMSHFIIKNRIDTPAQLRDFDRDGYVYNPSLSNDNTWVFTRKGN
ncbi:MAG: peroxide stress protein YaaA [Gammaproteobacteria bacterium]|nr:peroxide stress protein YaaA [Gammaproteobacteria bacterium]